MFYIKRSISDINTRVLILIVYIAIFKNILFAQPLKNFASQQNLIDSTATFQKIENVMNDYWNSQNVDNGYVIKNGIKTKVPGWKLYNRWQYYWEQRVNTQTGEFPKTNSIIEYEKYKKTQSSLIKANSFNESWINLGTNSSDGGYAGIGRINCIAFHPTDNNFFWVGSPSGGLWKTLDGGSTWTVLNDDQSVLGVSDIAVTSDYATSNTLYIATGDRDGGSMWSLSGGQGADNNSVGVLKSTDGGTSWNATGLSFLKSSGKIIYRLLIDPTNNLILFASTTDGIYKTTDAGTSWTLKTLNLWIDMEFNPANHNIICASSVGYGSSYINRSTDNGETWSFYEVETGGYRNELAVSPADPTVVYMLSSLNNGGLKGIYKSTNSGGSFTRVDDGTKSMLGYYSDGSGSNTGQGYYDLTIACSPNDVNIIYLGGVNTWKSTDGGANWVINNMWTSYAGYNFSGAPVAHADKHTLAFQNSSTLFEGNDGGIYKTTNGGTSWIDLSNGMVISQIYRLGVSQTNSSTIITGLQDNGSKLFTSGSWSDVKGGDGMECIVDHSNTSYMYATYVRGQISRSTNNGVSFPTDISANIPGGQPTGAWVTPYVMDPTNSSILYAGYDYVWKTENRGDSWTVNSQQLSAITKLRSLAIAPSNTNVLYAADQTNMWRTTDGGATDWAIVTLPESSNSLTYIAVKNDDPNTVWITFGGYTDGEKIYESTDGGLNWTNISTGLPNLPVMSIVYYKSITDRNVLFVGTDIGVYIKDGANAWASYNTGLPNVVVTELEIYYSGTIDKLRAATFGRGLWETDINSPLPVEFSSFTALVANNIVNLNWVTATEVNNYGFEVERKSNDDVLNKWEKIGFVNGSGNSNSPKNYSFKDNIDNGTYSYRLKQLDNDGHFQYSIVTEVFVNSVPDRYVLEQNFPNPFNPKTTISFQLKEHGIVQLKLLNILGQELATLINEMKPEGKYSIEFDASQIPSGIYIYSLKVNDFVQNRKMTLLK